MGLSIEPPPCVPAPPAVAAPPLPAAVALPPAANPTAVPRRRSLPAWLVRSRVQSLLSLPFIYGMALPFVVLDAAISLYQAACFPLYGIARVRRRDYFVLDRARLPYLNAVQKVNCAYCSYANGLLAYATQIVARTEQYWCPIKHARLPAAVHARYDDFIEYGDGDDYEARALALRSRLVAEAAAAREADAAGRRAPR